MEQLFYDAKQISKILGCGITHARTLMMEMPHFKANQGQRSPYRVRIEDFHKYIESHMVQPDEPQPRTSPYETGAQQIKRETENWHKQRREA